MEPVRKETAKNIARKEAIIQGALQLLQEEGSLDAISLRKLATILKLQAPALYWHFKNKRELIDYMAEAILQKEFSDLELMPEGEDWHNWLTTTMLQLRRAMLAYKDGGRIVAGAHLGPARTLARIMAYSFESLHKSGLAASDAQTIMMTALHFTFGRVIEEQDSPTKEEALLYTGKTTVFHEFPYLGKIVDTQSLDEEEFRRSLRLIIR